MREILFRGKRTCNNEWVEGGFHSRFEKAYIIGITKTEKIDGTEVIPKTAGQYTGLTDKNGKKIFEGDIVKAKDDVLGSPFCNGIIGKIVYDECAFFIEPKNPMDSQWLFDECAVYEIIGNIHDNPELLKGE